MKKEELNSIVEPLMKLQTIADCQSLLEKYLSFFFKVMRKHHYDTTDTQAKEDSKTIFQMFFTKALNLSNVLEGIEYDDGMYKLNNIIDPTILLTLTRNIFESLCAFELISIIPDTDEKKTIMYNLYKLSGLNYNQRFNNTSATIEMQKVYAAELLEIAECKNIINNTALYKALTPSNSKNIDKAIDSLRFQLSIDSSNNVNFLAWKNIPSLFGVSHSSFDNIYTLFSLNAHPSYVSMFQFRDMFHKRDPEYIKISLSGAKNFFCCFSIFLADYIELFPNIKKTYLELPIEDQILLNFHNRLVRGDKYSICDAWKNLNK